MSANIGSNDVVRQLDAKPEPDEQVTEEQVQEPPRLARLLMSLLRDVATLKRRWAPRRIDFEDRAVDGSGATKYRFTHGFGGRVRYWAVEWVGDPLTGGPCLERDADSTNDVLVLTSRSAGTATIRVEEAG